MKKVIIVIPIAVLLFAAALRAQNEVRVAAVFSKRTVTLQEEVKLAVRITGATTNLMRPRLPVHEAFDSFYAGRSNQFSFINGVSENATTFSYVLVPKRTGKFTYPPIEVEVGNEIFRTSEVTLEVLGVGGIPAAAAPAQTPAPYTPAPAPYTGQQQQQPQQQQQSQPAPVPAYQPGNMQAPPSPPIPVNRAEDIFLDVALDKKEAYPGEQVILTYTIYTRYSTKPEQFDQDPDFTGFWVEEIPPDQNVKPEKVTMNGHLYLKAVLIRMALFPTKTGILQINPGLFRATIKKENNPSNLFDEFFNESFFGGSFFTRSETRLLPTQPVQLTVKPLPEQGKPANFAGAVGAFRMNSTIDTRSVKQNEPVQLTVNIEGEGNIEMLEQPFVPEMKDVKVYDTDSSTQIVRNQRGVQGRKSFTMPLIPTEAGQTEIPPLTFSYFDIYERRYKTLKTSPFQISVAPGPKVDLPPLPSRDGSGKQDSRENVKLENRDIHFIQDKISLYGGPLRAGNILKASALANILLTLLAAFLWSRRRAEEKWQKNIPLKRSRFALRYFEKSMAALRKLSRARSADKKKHFFEQAPVALNAYFADKFNLSAYGITSFEIEMRLGEAGFPEDKLKALNHFYTVCDQHRFTGAPAAAAEPEELMKIMRDAALWLEKKK